MSIAPQVDEGTLLRELNSVRLEGRRLEDEFRIHKIKRIIEKMRDQYRPYHVSLAALYCLTGDYDKMKYHGDLGINNANLNELSYHTLTLTFVGFFTEARKLVDTFEKQDFLDAKDEVNPFIVKLSLSNQAYKLMNPIIDKIPDKDFSKLLVDSMDILDRQGVDERDILKMLDLAGQLIRENHLLAVQAVRVIPNVYNQTINISIPINLAPKELVDLEWEFNHLMYERLPDAPYQTVHVGFCLPQ